MRKLFVLIGAVAGALVPASAFASGPLTQINPCPVAGLSCPGDFVSYVYGIIGLGSGSAGAVRAFIGILAAMLVYYGIRLIMDADNDSTTAEVKSAYGHALVGAILVGAAGLLADTFASTTESSATFITPGPTIGAISNVIVSLKGLVYTALVFNLSYQGIRLVMHQDESQAEKAKKQFLYGIIGAMVVILADAVVSAFVSRDVLIINNQLIGIITFLLTILGALAVLAIFVAGIFLVISLDESLKDRAKKSVLAALVTLAVVILSLSILMIFVEAPIG